MEKYQIIEELVNTRINGNSIKGNKTYENMLKRVTKDNILDYHNLYSIDCFENIYGSKLEMIEQIRNSVEG